MQEIAMRTFAPYRNAILYSASIGKYRHDPLLNRAVEMVEGGLVPRCRMRLICAIERVCQLGGFFVFDYKDGYSMANTSTAFLFDHHTKFEHFLFFVPKKEGVINLSGDLMNFNKNSLSTLPFMIIRKMYAVIADETQN